MYGCTLKKNSKENKVVQSLRNFIKDPGSAAVHSASLGSQAGPSVWPLADTSWVSRVRLLYEHSASGWRKWMLPFMSHALLGEKIFPQNPQKTSSNPVGDNWTICLPQSECLCPQPQHPQGDIITPKEMVPGGGPFGRWLDHTGRTLVNGIGALIKEARESSLAPATLGGHRENVLSLRKQVLLRHQICQCHELGLPSLQNGEK